MKIVKIDSELIVPYEKNVKKHAQNQIENIMKSIQDVWFVQPIIVDENNVILVGHGRFEACKQLWYDKVECVVLDKLNETQKKALRIRDNKLSESPYDIVNLRDELSDIMWEIDLQELWFNITELDDLRLRASEPSDEDEAEDIEESGLDIWSDEDNEMKGIPQTYDFKNQNGEISQKKVMTFFLTPEEYEQYGKLFETTRKVEYNFDLLKSMVDFYQSQPR